MSDNFDERLEQLRPKKPVQLPQRVRLLAMNVPVVVGDLGDDHGAWDSLEGQIVINQHLGKVAATHVLLHEVIHALAHFQGLDLSEQDVDNLASGIVSIVGENPELVALIQEVVNG